MFEYRQVLVRMRQGDSDRAIARTGLMGRDKAREVRAVAAREGWLEAAALPDDGCLAKVFGTRQRPSTTSSVEPFRELVVRWHAQGIQKTTIHRLLKRQRGFAGSYSAVRRFVAQLDPGPASSTMRLTFAPGEAAQVDFGTGPRLPDPATGEPTKTWFFVMTLCWSRHQYAELVWDQTVPTWLGCHQRAFRSFGGVTERVTIDNPKCAITKACRYEPEVQRAYGELAEAYDFKIDACPPRDPEKKGRVEAGVKYVKRAFLPGRTFRDLEDANRQLEAWVHGEAGQRIHGTTRERPLTRFAETERGELRTLPERVFEPAEWGRRVLHKDCHVRFAQCFYSAPWTLIGSRLWLRASAEKIDIFQDYQLVATHVRRKRPGESATVVDHLAPECRAFLEQTPEWCRAQAKAVGGACRMVVDHLFADRIHERLRAVQSLLRLRQGYGEVRLESACRRALAFDDPSYRTIKTILSKGLDQIGLIDQAFDELAQVYTGAGRYHRDTRTLLTH